MQNSRLASALGLPHSLPWPYGYIKFFPTRFVTLRRDEPNPEQEIYRQILGVLFFGILYDCTGWFQIWDSQGLRFAAKTLVACALFFKHNPGVIAMSEYASEEAISLIERRICFAERLWSAHRLAVF